MNRKADWTPLHDVLARAYVLGWCDGRNGVLNDDVMMDVASKLAKRLMTPPLDQAHAEPDPDGQIRPCGARMYGCPVCSGVYSDQAKARECCTQAPDAYRDMTPQNGDQ